jgi:hypothetical protein
VNSLFVIVGLILGILSGIFAFYLFRKRVRGPLGPGATRQFFGSILRTALAILAVGGLLYSVIVGTVLILGARGLGSLAPRFSLAPVPGVIQTIAGYIGGIFASAIGGFFGMIIYDRYRENRKPRTPASTGE